MKRCQVFLEVEGTNLYAQTNISGVFTIEGPRNRGDNTFNKC